MAEENSFKENLNWKKLSIDAVNTIIATAIGIILGLLVDNWREKVNNQENYQKVIVATIVNLENYQKQIENLKTYSDYGESVFEELTSEDYEISDSTIEDLKEIFFTEDFKQQDRWIEENFITNGGFIEDADLRLKIGNVYSLIDLCKHSFVDLKEYSNKAYDKYLQFYVNEKPQDALEKIISNQECLAYISKIHYSNAQLDEWIQNIADLNTEIIKMAKADEKQLNG